MDFQRKTYVETNDFKVYLEEIQGQVFIHVHIYNFSKSILKEIKKYWAEIVYRMYLLGYENLYAYTKDHRIINMIGGAKQIDKTKDNYEVWKWEFN